MSTTINSSLARWGLSFAILYLATHAVTGDQGLFSFVRLQERERDLQRESARLAADIAELNRRAARLKPESLDLDYLEERARVMLGAGYGGEMVVALGDGENASLP